MPESWFSSARQHLAFADSGNWTDEFGSEIERWLKDFGPSKVETLSLFSGAGGLDIGFHDAGFKVRDMVEIETAFAATLSNNAQHGEIFDGATVHAIDIRNFDLPEDSEYEFIIGGPPCQTFSAAGRRAAGVKGTSDPRGVLFEDYVRLLIKAKPRGFLFENVYGIVGAEKGEPWRLIINSFEEAGYRLQYRILDSADYGVPQHRERLFIVGIRQDLADQGLEFKFPRPTHGPDSADNRPFNTAGNALKKLRKQVSKGTAIQGRWAHLISEIPPGLNYSYFTAEMGHPRPVFAWRSKFSDFMYKADPETPVRTVKAQGGAYTGPLSWENRHFTIEEFKRLQTFPDAYQISGSRAEQIHQIGNSVPPQIARILGLAVLDQVFGVKLPFALEYLDESETLGFRSRKRESTKRYAAKAAASIALRPADHAVTIDDFAKSLEGRFVITDSFELADSPDLFAEPFTIESSATDGQIELRISTDSTSTNESSFDFQLICREGANWPLPFQKVTISAPRFNRNTFTGPLKVLEYFMRTHYGIEDLIQLNGYYQNSSSFDVSLTSSNQYSLAMNLSKLIDGNLAGKILPVDVFEEALQISGNQIKEFMDELRELGFEVRNANTNPQIPENNFLVPYLFPTLNARSTQLRKSLR